MRIFNRPETIERLIVTPARYRDALPRCMRECLPAGEACYAHELKLRAIDDKRYGNVLAGRLNFRRKVETRGWEFNAVVVLIDGWSTRP